MIEPEEFAGVENTYLAVDDEKSKIEEETTELDGVEPPRTDFQLPIKPSMNVVGSSG